MLLYWGTVIVIIVVLFAIIAFTGRKRKEYAVYEANGDVLHLYRRSQNWWFDWFGEKVFYKENGMMCHLTGHWLIRWEELQNGEWQKIVEARKEKEDASE